MTRTATLRAEIRELIPVPDHSHALAAAVRYDLMHGPAWARIPAAGIEAFTADDFASDQESLTDDQADHGGRIVQAFSDDITGPLRAFLSDLPAVYLDNDTGEVSLEMPQQWVATMPRNVEVFWHDGLRVADGDCWGTGEEDADGEEAARPEGWYWWTCCPGCMPDSNPFGPFDTEAEAEADAIEQYDEPEGEGAGYWEDKANAWEIEQHEVVAALFGETIARDFPL